MAGLFEASVPLLQGLDCDIEKVNLKLNNQGKLAAPWGRLLLFPLAINSALIASDQLVPVQIDLTIKLKGIKGRMEG